MKSINKLSIIFATSIFTSQLNIVLAIPLKNISNINTKNDVLPDNLFDKSNYSKKVSEKLEYSLELLSNYKESKDIVKLKECILTFNSIPYLMEVEEIDIFTDGDIFDYIYYNIRDEVYTLEDEELKSSMIIYLGENLFLGWRKFKMIDIYGGKYLVRDLVDYNKDKVSKAQSRLEYLKFLYNYFLEHPDYDYESDEIPIIDTNKTPQSPTINPPEVEEDNTNSSDSINNGNSSSEKNDEVDNNKHIIKGSFTEYEKRNNKCYEVEYEYNNEETVVKSELLLPKDEYVKCGIYTYIHEAYAENNFEAIIDRDYLENDQNIFSKNTLHYTINKESKYPYYFNTFIKTSIDNDSVSYNQLKDAMYQLAIKANGVYIVSNDKQLTILDGKPIVLDSKKSEYSKEEVESMMDDFLNFGFKIMEHSPNKQYTLQSSILSGDITSILVNEEERALMLMPKLIENKLFLPAVEIAQHLDSQTYLKENSLLIVKNDLTINIAINNKEYLVNDKNKIFEIAPVLIDNEMYIDFSEICIELGYEMIWDSDEGELSFNKK